MLCFSDNLNCMETLASSLRSSAVYLFVLVARRNRANRLKRLNLLYTVCLISVTPRIAAPLALPSIRPPPFFPFNQAQSVKTLRSLAAYSTVLRSWRTWERSVCINYRDAKMTSFGTRLLGSNVLKLLL